MLVLEVPLGSTRVVLARKRYGDRCQLWRRGPNGQLVHEGSSVPQPTDALRAEDAPLSPHCQVSAHSLAELHVINYVALRRTASCVTLNTKNMHLNVEHSYFFKSVFFTDLKK